MQKKTLVSYIYIGKPKDTNRYGEEPRIQLNDALAAPTDVVQFVNQEKDKLSEGERDQITMAMKVDIEAKMGIVSDVQQELREANALKVLYTSLLEMDQL
jgi:hypothetical protein